MGVKDLHIPEIIAIALLGWGCVTQNVVRKVVIMQVLNYCS